MKFAYRIRRYTWPHLPKETQELYALTAKYNRPRSSASSYASSTSLDLNYSIYKEQQKLFDQQQTRKAIEIWLDDCFEAIYPVCWDHIAVGADRSGVKVVCKDGIVVGVINNSALADPRYKPQSRANGTELWLMADARARMIDTELQSRVYDPGFWLIANARTVTFNTQPKVFPEVKPVKLADDKDYRQRMRKDWLPKPKRDFTACQAQWEGIFQRAKTDQEADEATSMIALLQNVLEEKLWLEKRRRP
ncbi:MAG: hypothetical protein Q9218_005736 [Villophora microphyllina]